jgi:hypothetical protein
MSRKTLDESTIPARKCTALELSQAKAVESGLQPRGTTSPVLQRWPVFLAALREVEFNDVND